MSEKMEIDIVVNGKKAVSSIEQVDKATKKLADETKKTDKEIEKSTKSISLSWSKVGASIAVAGGAMGIASAKALSLSKAMFGLNEGMQLYIREMSNATGLSQDVIAGFVRTGASAGMAVTEIKEMVDMAVALGRAYPHESTEAFIDNLVQLNRTGEAQGYIVDILEQKYGLIDLKALSLTEKMDTLKGAIEGVNEQFDKTAGAKIDKLFREADNAITEFGRSLVTIADEWGWLDGAVGLMQELTDSFTAINNMTMTQLNRELVNVNEQLAEAKALHEAMDVLNPLNFFKKSEQEQNIKDLENQKQLLEQQIEARIRLREEENKKDPTPIKEADLCIQDDEKKPLEFYTADMDMDAHVQAFKDAEKEKIEALRERKMVEEDVANRKNQLVDQMTDATVRFVMGEKLAFRDMANSMIADLMRVYVRQLMVRAVGGVFGGIFHTGGEVKHTGGYIGSNLPTYHTGIRSDERVAKLQVGEAVINRAGARNNAQAIDAMNAGYKVGGGGDNITTAEINFNVQAIDASSFNSYLVNNKSTIEGIINNSLRTNGSVRKTIKQTV